MSTFGDSQVRKLFIANAVNDAVRSTPALLAEGEVQAFAADGDGVPAAGEKFFIATKSDGKINRTEIIDPAKKLAYTKDKVFGPKILKWVVNLANMPSSGVGETVDFVISIENYGANNSSSEPYFFHASHTIVAGDTLTSIAEGIVNTGNLAAAKTGLPIAFTNSSNVVTIQTGRTPFKLGKLAGEPLNAKLVVKTFDTGLTATIAETATTVTDNGIEVANMEWFMLGNTGDIYRGTAYPTNTDSHYVADTSANYKAVEVAYYSERISAPGDKQRAMFTIVYKDSLDATDVATQITDPLDTILG